MDPTPETTLFDIGAIRHILEAIKRIDSYTEDMDELAFLNNRLVQDAVIRNFEIIGEASNNIGRRYPNFAVANPESPLSFAYQQVLEVMPKDFHEISFD
ncbi:DUF86 domain-containing protein [Photorhabdus sp. RM323S]|uniref:HepT-like ribonuclease domain-containing protein n=1 Tax=Photorhabdus sp. RM323S TaxID=3342828 RepID=UPI0036DA9667